MNINIVLFIFFIIALSFCSYIIYEQHENIIQLKDELFEANEKFRISETNVISLRDSINIQNIKIEDYQKEKTNLGISFDVLNLNLEQQMNKLWSNDKMIGKNEQEAIKWLKEKAISLH